MNINSESLFEDISQGQLNDLEKFADRLLSKFNIDVEFTRHFADRTSDSRNDPSVKVSELQSLFKRIHKDKAAKILKHKGNEAVLIDIQKDLNLPFVLKKKPRSDELELVMKTIMRKQNFKTSNPKVQYESAYSFLEEDAVIDLLKHLSPFIWPKNYQAAKKDYAKELKDANKKKDLNLAAHIARRYRNVDSKIFITMLESKSNLKSFGDFIQESRHK